MNYQPKRMMVTGGAGFIGCNFIRYLLNTDSTVHIVNLDKLTYAGSLENLNNLPDDSRYTFVKGDICDDRLVKSLLEKYEIDTIVNFAAESHVDRSITGPASFIETNIVGTFTLLDAARQFWLEENKWGDNQCRFHHISTDEVYGTLAADDPAFSETTPYAPNSPYSASKAGSDHLARAWHHTYGLPVTTTNCSNNYGPHQHGEKFIPTIIRCCLDGKSIPIYGNGSNIRDWLYVEDHCRGIDVVLRRGDVGEVYNIGGCNEWSNIDICKLICSLMDELRSKDSSYSGLISYVTDRPGHDWRYAIDTSKMADEFGWTPIENFETWIRRYLQWFFDNSSSLSDRVF